MRAKCHCCKRSAVGAKGVVGIDMILALLEGFLGGARVPDDCLELKEQIDVELCDLLQISLGVLGRSRSRN